MGVNVLTLVLAFNYFNRIVFMTSEYSAEPHLIYSFVLAFAAGLCDKCMISCTKQSFWFVLSLMIPVNCSCLFES